MGIASYLPGLFTTLYWQDMLYKEPYLADLHYFGPQWFQRNKNPNVMNVNSVRLLMHLFLRKEKRINE